MSDKQKLKIESGAIKVTVETPDSSFSVNIGADVPGAFDSAEHTVTAAKDASLFCLLNVFDETSVS